MNYADVVKRHAMNLGYRTDADDDGKWITTKNGHHVHLNEEGEPDKGNPHVVAAMNGESSAEPKSSAGSAKSDAEYKKRLNNLKFYADYDEEETIRAAMDMAYDFPEKFYEITDALKSSGLDERLRWEMGPANTNGIEEVVKPAIEKAKKALKEKIPSPPKNQSTSAVINGKEIMFSNVKNAMYPTHSKQQRFIDIRITDPDTGDLEGSYAANDYDSAMAHVYRIVGLRTK